MANLSEDIKYAGSDTRPPMLERTGFASWQQRIRLYCRGKENGVNILKLIDEGPFQMGIVRETLVEGTEGVPHLGPKRPRVKRMRVNILKSIDEGPFQMRTFRETLTDENEGALHLGPKQSRVYFDLSPGDNERYNDYVKILMEGFELTKEDRESQLYNDFEHFCQNKGETIHDYYVMFTKLINDMQNIKMTMPRMQFNLKFVNNMLPECGRFVTAVKLNRGLKESNYDQLYAYLKHHEAHANENKMMLERFTQHTVDPIALMSNVSPQQYSSQSTTTPPSIHVPPVTYQPHFADNTQINSGLSTTDNLIENLTNTLALLTQSYKTYLPQTNSSRRQSCGSECLGSTEQSSWEQCKGNRCSWVVLDEEQLLFLTGGQDNIVVEDVDEPPVQDLALNVDNVFQADECDAFDSNIDEAPTAQTMFMSNLSSVDTVYDAAGPSYNSDILSEVHDHDNYQDAICKHHEVHEMHDNVQPNCVVDLDAEYMSDNNMILYDQYTAQCVSMKAHTKVVDVSLTTELATYKEQVELYERLAKFELTERKQKIEELLRIVITDRNIKEENLKKEFHYVKMQLNSTINHNKSMVEEVTPLKKDFKQKENKHLEEFLDMKALKEKNSDYFKDKMLLMQAQENGVALDEEQLLFLADDYDVFDFDVDEAFMAQTMFMANLSSTDPVYDEARTSYDSDILSEDIYTLINHYTNAKDIWDNVKMLLEGSELTKEDWESQLQGNIPRGGGAVGYVRAQHRVGNANPGQARQLKWYNYNGIGHITRNCTQPKCPENFEYFKDKMLLMQAQENSVAMDEKQLLFLVDNCDAFDSDIDEAPTTETMFMANLSSADPVYDEDGPSYDLDILSEDNAVPGVQSNVSSIPNDTYMMIYNDMYEPHAQSISKTSQNRVVDNLLTVKLGTYKEQVKMYERRA
nr:hypothetical protein [Tanacetum cinerariifolium]